MIDIRYIIFSGFILSFFTVFYFLMKRPSVPVNRIVILFVLSLVSPMFIKFLEFNHIKPPLLLFEFFIASPFTLGPLLYIYTCFETGIIEQFRRIDILHFVPYFTAVIVLIIFNMIMPPVNKGPVDEFGNYHPGFVDESLQFHKDIESIPPPPPPPPHEEMHMLPDIIMKLLAVAVYISFNIYTVRILFIIRKHNLHIGDYFSTENIQINLKWIKWITISFFLSYFIVLIAAFYPSVDYLSNFHLLKVVPDIVTVFFIFSFSFFSIKQTEISGINKAGSSADENNGNSIRKYEKSGLKDNMADEYQKLLIDFMNREKPYREPDLTINDLSERLNIPKHHITQVLNEKINKNFFMFVNEFRIDEVKEKITNDEFNEHSILRVAFEAGFNSKSTFNEVFKKATGQTPTQYRKTFCTKVLK